MIVPRIVFIDVLLQVPDAAAAVEILAKRGDTTCVLNDSSVIFAEKNQAAIFAGVDIANPLITAQGPWYVV